MRDLIANRTELVLVASGQIVHVEFQDMSPIAAEVARHCADSDVQTARENKAAAVIPAKEETTRDTPKTVWPTPSLISAHLVTYYHIMITSVLLDIYARWHYEHE